MIRRRRVVIIRRSLFFFFLLRVVFSYRSDDGDVSNTQAIGHRNSPPPSFRVKKRQCVVQKKETILSTPFRSFAFPLGVFYPNSTVLTNQSDTLGSKGRLYPTPVSVCFRGFEALLVRKGHHRLVLVTEESGLK